MAGAGRYWVDSLIRWTAQMEGAWTAEMLRSIALQQRPQLAAEPRLQPTPRLALVAGLVAGAMLGIVVRLDRRPPR